MRRTIPHLIDKHQIIALAVFLWTSDLSLFAQTFPNAAQLSTGQGQPGQIDPLWLSSDWFDIPPTSPIGIAFDSCLINNSCAPGAWVDPTTLPPPVNNANWITGIDVPCDQNLGDGYQFFRLPLNLPSTCNGESILDEGVYHLFLSGYADNSIHDVFINGISQGISGGDFTPGGFLQMDLDGPWQAGENFVDVLIYNIPNGTFNPYGLLLVADSNAGANSDLDNDGVADFLDECPCLPGNNSNGCPSDEFQFTLCSGESLTLTAPSAGFYNWSSGETSPSIVVSPEESTTYELSIVDASQNSSTYIYQVTVNSIYMNMSSVMLCEGQTLIINGNIIKDSGIYETVYSTVEGCDSVVVTEVELLPSPSSTFQFNLCQGDSLIFNNAVYSESGEFVFTYVTESGCDSLVILDISEIICVPCRYFFPNIFTPNGDGLNDVFDINEGSCQKEGYLVEIYNRWGIRVYSSDSPDQYWNGQYQGDLCSDGTYYYVSNYIDVDGKRKRKTGYVQLLANE